MTDDDTRDHTLVVETSDTALYYPLGNPNYGGPLLNYTLQYTLVPCNSSALWTNASISGTLSSPYELIDVAPANLTFNFTKCASYNLGASYGCDPYIDPWYFIQPTSSSNRFMSLIVDECVWETTSGILSYEDGPCSGYRPTKAYNFAYNASAGIVYNTYSNTSWPVTPREEVCTAADENSVLLQILPATGSCIGVSDGSANEIFCNGNDPTQAFVMTTDGAGSTYLEPASMLGTCLSAESLAIPVPVTAAAVQGTLVNSSLIDMYQCASAFPVGAMVNLWMGRTNGFVLSDTSSNIYEMFANGTVKVFYNEQAFGGAVLTVVKCDVDSIVLRRPVKARLRVCLAARSSLPC